MRSWRSTQREDKPLLPNTRVMHHSNVATVTKQKVFHKAIVNKHTEVIFIDEVTPPTLEVDDWKSLTRGGYTACDVKYRTARSFFNRCPLHCKSLHLILRISMPWTEGCDTNTLRAFQIQNRERRSGCSSTQ